MKKSSIFASLILLVAGLQTSCNKEDPAPSITGITLSETSITLNPGETASLSATVEPSGADNSAISWVSSNKAVAEVNGSGIVTAIANGTCVISCSATDGSGVKAECKVTVETTVETFTVNGVTFKMRKVAGGTFTMGATAEQSNGYTPNSDETPTHLVTLSDYWMGETEVTQALWYAVMGEKPSSSKSWNTSNGLGEDYPAYWVSWVYCQEFITKLNQMTGKTFRLPTEAEWEYAARGGSKSQGYIFSGSNTIDDVAWYRSNSGSCSHPVATKAANELGLYDMSGNVWEWCQDWDHAYSSISQTNPTGPTSGTYRVYRGGSWIEGGTNCRVAKRARYYQDKGVDAIGFRLAQ